MDDTVRIYVEGDLNLGYAAGRGGDTRGLEFSQGEIVFGECPFSLDYMDLDTGLTVSSS